LTGCPGVIDGESCVTKDNLLCLDVYCRHKKNLNIGVFIKFKYIIRSGILAAFFLTCLTVLSNTVAARPMAYLGFEKDQDTAFEPGDSCCKWIHDSWNNITFRMPLQSTSDRDLQLAWLSKSIANEGNQSLGIWLKENQFTGERQRMEFQIANSLYFRPVLEESLYYSVAMYIHPQSANTLRKGVVFMQAWQVHDTSSSKHAPFSIRFDDMSNYKWTVYTATDVPGVDTRYTQGTKTAIYTSPVGLTKGVWHEFVVWFKPSIEKKGAVRVWHNGQLVVSQTNQRNFGYEPQTASPFMTNRLEYRFGAYRVTGPDYPGDVILMYDQAKLGRTYEEVDP
jgi:hypothetical protein